MPNSDYPLVEYITSTTSRSFDDIKETVDIVRKVCKDIQYEDFRAILALIYGESRFNPNAVSSANAKGLMQIIPSTWNILKQNLSRIGVNIANILNKRDNVTAGSYHYYKTCIKPLLKYFNAKDVYELFQANIGQYERLLRIAVISYNAGESVGLNYAKGKRTWNSLAGQTRTLVNTFKQYYDQIKHLKYHVGDIIDDDRDQLMIPEQSLSERNGKTNGLSTLNIIFIIVIVIAIGLSGYYIIKKVKK